MRVVRFTCRRRSNATSPSDGAKECLSANIRAHDGKEIDTPKIDVWTFRNGKAVRFFEMFDSLGFARTASLI